MKRVISAFLFLAVLSPSAHADWWWQAKKPPKKSARAKTTTKAPEVAVAAVAAPAAGQVESVTLPSSEGARLYLGMQMPVPFEGMGPEVTILGRLGESNSYLGTSTGFLVASDTSSDLWVFPLLMSYQYRVTGAGFFHPYFGLGVGAALWHGTGNLVGGDDEDNGSFGSSRTFITFAAATRIGFEFALSDVVSIYAEPRLWFFAGSGALGLTFNPIAGFAFGL